MLKQAISFEVKKNERTYSLHMPVDAPLGEVHDVLFQMRSYVVERINEAQKQDAPSIVEEAPKSE